MRKYLIFVTVALFLGLVSAEVPDDEFLMFDGDDAWIYYGPGESFENPSNNLNLVFRGSSSDLKNISEDLGWVEVEGTDRFAYINGEWILEDFQMGYGEYFTTRHHYRAYSGEENTFVQAHYEHFDFFSLTHEVESNSKARAKLENQLESKGLELEALRNENANLVDSRGRITLAALAGLLASLSFTSSRKENLRVYTAPVIGFTALIIGSRYLAVLLDNYLSAHPIFALIFPLYLLGLPLITYLYSRDLQGLKTPILVFSGFMIAVMLDYFILGVEAVPTEIFAHRLLAGLALSSISVAAIKAKKEYIVLASVFWLMALEVSLFLI